MANITFTGTGANVGWGTNVINTITNTVSVISGSYTDTGETIPVLSNLGIPDGMVTVPGIVTATQAAYYKTGSLPAIGDLKEIATIVNCVVDNIDVAWEQKGITKATVKGSKLPA